MSPLWQTHPHKLTGPSVRQLRAFRLPFWHRWDAWMLAGMIAAIVILFSGWSLGISALRRARVFDQPGLVTLLPDERLTRNVRDDLSRWPILDAARHGPSGILYLSQTGGVVHRYDPATKLWRSELPPLPAAIENKSLAQIRFGNGEWDMLDADTLWGRGPQGSLARFRGGTWEVITTDSAFVGLDGKPVEAAQVTASAISRDRQWLLAGTKADGVGLYHVPTRAWTRVETNVYSRAGFANVKEILWWKDVFVVTSGGGAATLEPRPERGGRLEPIAALTNELVDVELSPRNTLWVLERQANGALRLSELRSARARPIPAFDEKNLFRNLDLSGVQFAQQQNDRLFLAGVSGVFVYDTKLHSWDRLFDGEVLCTLPLADGRGFYFGHRGGVKLVTDRVAVEWAASSAVVRLRFDPTNQPLALLQNGQLTQLIGGGKQLERFAASRTQHRPGDFANAFEVSGSILFGGPKGGLIHGPVDRNYQDIDAKALPDALKEGETRHVSAQGNSFFASPDNGRRGGLSTIGNDALLAQNFNALSRAGTVAWPLKSFRAWGAGAGLLDADGLLHEIAAGRNASVVAGLPRGGRDGWQLADVGTSAGAGWFLAGDGLWRYDYTSRSWSSNLFNLAVRELCLDDQRPLVVTRRGDLFDASGNSLDLLIGGESQGIPSSSVEDALVSGDRWFLAGQSRVAAYEPDRRRFVDEWTSPSPGEIRLAGAASRAPVFQSGTKAWHGKVSLADSDEKAITLSADDRVIALVTETERRALKVFPYDSRGHGEPDCFFRFPTAGAGATEIIDALALPDGNFLVSLNSGLRLYSPTARSWYAFMDRWIPPAGRLYRIKDHILIADERNAFPSLHFVPLASLPAPLSCDPRTISFRSRTTFEVKAFALDPASGTALFVNRDNALDLWRDGKTTMVLNAPGAAPDPRSLREVVLSGSPPSHLVFTTSREFRSYDLRAHTWASYSKPPLIMDGVHIEGGSVNTVTVRSTDGALHLGTLDPTTKSLSLARVFTPPVQRFTGDGHPVLDVQMREDYWVFVCTNELRFYEPARRQWLPPVSLARSSGSHQLAYVGQRPVVVERNGVVWLGANPDAVTPFARYAPEPVERVALDGGGRFWTLKSDGSLSETAITGSTVTPVLVRKPMKVDPAGILQTFRWRRFGVFVTTAGVRVYDHDQAREVAQDAVAWSGPVRAVEWNNRFWLASASTLMQIRDDSPPKLSVVTGFSEFRLTAGAAPWILLTNSWYNWSGNGLVGRTAATFNPVFAREGDTPTAITTNRSPWDWAGGTWRRDAHLLPPEVNPLEVRHLARDDPDGWWVVFSNRVVILGNRIVNGGVATNAPRPFPGADWRHQVAAPLTSTASNALLSPIAYAARGARQLDLLSATGTGVRFTDNDTNGIGTAWWSSAGNPASLPSWIPATARWVYFDEVRRRGWLFTAKESVLFTLVNTTNGQHLVVSTNTSAPLPFAFDPGTLTRPFPVTDVSLTVIAANGSTLTVQGTGSGTYLASAGVDGESFLGNEIAPAQLQTNIARVPDGALAYDAITAWSTNSSGDLLAHLPGGPRLITRGAALLDPGPFQPGAALDVGWLKWDRSGPRFIIQTPEGLRSIQTEDFIQNGQLLFEKADMAFNKDGGDMFLVNRYGVWRYASRDLELGRPVTFRPAPNREARAIAGGFLLDGSQWVECAGTMSLQAPAPRVVQVGAVTFSPEVAASPFRAELSRGGTSLPALNSAGFLWDARQSLAMDQGDVLVESAAGLHSLTGLNRFSDPPIADGRLRSESRGDIFYRGGDQWFHQESGRWTATKDPALNRLLAAGAGWTWKRSNGAVSVEPPRNRGPLPMVSTPDGLAFSSDLLRDAAVIDGRLHVFSEAFHESAASAEELASWKAEQLPAVALDRVETLPDRSGVRRMFRHAGGQLSRWDSAARSFAPVAAADDPYRQRLLLNTDRLRLTREGPTVRHEVGLEPLSGARQWVEFRTETGRFPWDEVTSASVFAGKLFLGTAAGVEVHRDRNLGLRQVESLMDMRGSAGGLAVACDRLGVPVVRPAELLLRSANECWATTDGRTFRRGAVPAELNSRQRAQTDFWLWYEDDSGVVGLYRDEVRRPRSVPIALTNGRFAHDQLRDFAFYGGESFTLWDNGWVSVHKGAQVGVHTDVINHNLTSNAPVRFISIPKVTPHGRGFLQPALYLEGEARRLWEYRGGTWQEVAGAGLRVAVLEHAAAPPVFAEGQLRLRRTNDTAAFQFEQRTLGGDWRVLTWSGAGCLSIDDWREFVPQAAGIWAVTPEGFTLFQRGPTNLLLNPNQLLVVREPVANTTNVITDALITPTSVIVRVDGRTNQLFTAVLGTVADTNVFSRVTMKDPFAEQEWVGPRENDYWQWGLRGHVDGNPGWLDCTLRTEKVQIAGGRFEFDDLRSLCVFRKDVLELSTEQAGWFTAGDGDLHLRQWKRPAAGRINPRDVAKIFHSQVESNAVLGLKLANDDGYRLSVDGVITADKGVREYLGFDGFWSYWRKDPQIETTAANVRDGVVVGSIRSLHRGRFTDDIVVGLPAMRQVNGELRHFIPTEAGVYEMDADVRPVSIRIPPFDGLGGRRSPSVLWAGEAVGPLYHNGRDLLRPLYSAAGDSNAVKLAGVPEAAAVERIFGKWLKVRYRDHGLRWMLQEPGGATDAGALSIAVGRFDRFLERKGEWGYPAPWLLARLTEKQLEFSKSGSATAHAVPLPADFEPVEVFVAGEQVILLGAHELYEINVVPPMERVFDGPSP